MSPRLDALKNRPKKGEVEAFNLDIVDFKEAYKAEEYLSKGFEDVFKYELRSLVFFPKQKVCSIMIRICNSRILN